MNNVYDEESQIEDLNVEADRIIAMNPSGIIENFTEDVNGKKVHCDGDKCVILGNDEVENCINGVCEIKKETSYSKYIIYFVIFLAICTLAYFIYKKYSKCDS